jgi:hypothetical protein
VYVDADELPGAVRPSGTYTVQGDKILVRLVLRRDGMEVARLQVDGADGPARPGAPDRGGDGGAFEITLAVARVGHFFPDTGGRGTTCQDSNRIS